MPAPRPPPIAYRPSPFCETLARMIQALVLRRHALLFFALVLLGLSVLEHQFAQVAAQQPPAAPRYQVDPFWPKMPKGLILGQVSGITVDSRDHIWLIQRPWSLESDEKALNPEAECCREAPPVMEFDADGNYIQGWGGEGAGYEWPKD